MQAVRDGAEAEENVLVRPPQEEDNGRIEQGQQPAAAAADRPTAPTTTDEQKTKMHLSGEERDWALIIKEAIEENSELRNLSDFTYAQLAIIHQDNLETAVEMAGKLQYTMQEYGILDTWEDGLVKIPKALHLFPGLYLSFGYSHHDECYVLVFDIPKMNLQIMHDDMKNIHTWFAGAYYVHHCLNPDFEAMRKGSVYIAECQGYDWTPKMQDMKYSEKYWDEVGGIYPMKIRQLKCFHTPTIFNVLKAMTRAFTPPHIHSKFQLGCMFHGRLDSFYLLPNQKVALERIQAKMTKALKMRYENERDFRL